MRAGGECITVQLDGGLEACNGQDDDFDGEIDENNPGGGGTCGSNDGECGEGVLTCTDGVLVCDGEVEPVDEACDDLDNDCDGNVDEDLLSTLYQDLDEDGVGSDVECTQCGECEGMGPWVVATGDCDDMCDTCSPLEVEVCDGVDNNCDGDVDEELIMTFYSDEDRDAFGTDVTCMGCGVDGCDGEAEDWAMTAGDCDPVRDDVFPGALEVCDGVDNDCDGATDEALLTTYYRDEDRDGYGTDETCEACTVSECPGGDDVWATVDGDCDDTSSGGSVNPGVPEICDYVDNNCVDGVDEGVTELVYDDADGDGYGVGAGRQGCPDNLAVEPDGAARVDGDCADEDARAHPTQSDFYSEPIMGSVPSGLRHDFDCDGNEEVEHLLCTSCLRNACWAYELGCGDWGRISSAGIIVMPGMPDRCFRIGEYSLAQAGCR